MVVTDGDVLNRRQNQRDLAELLRVKLGVASVDEQLRRLVHTIVYNHPELALTARMRAADTRDDAVADVKRLEGEQRLTAGTTDQLVELLTAVYSS